MACAGVTSREIAERLCRWGKLRNVLLLPAGLGGKDIAANVTYLRRHCGSLDAGTMLMCRAGPVGIMR